MIKTHSSSSNTHDMSSMNIMAMEQIGWHAEWNGNIWTSIYCAWSLCLFVSVCGVKSENVHLLDGHVYVMLLLSDGLSAYNTWYSSWTIVPRGPSIWHSVWLWAMNIHVLLVRCMHWLNYCHLTNHCDCLGSRHSIEISIDFWKL